MIHPEIEAVAVMGWRVYPASQYSKAGCIKRGTDLATCDLNQISKWTKEFLGCNWRVVMHGSYIWALDCDVPPGHTHDGVANLAAFAKVHGGLPPRPTARSGGGGLIVFFSHTDERIIGDAGHPVLGVDPRRGRQSQTIPPSIHIRTRQPYRWLVKPWEVAPPPAPAWLLRALQPPPEPIYRQTIIDTADAARNRLYRAVGAVMTALDGSRNQALNRSAFQVGKLIGAGLLGEYEAIDALYGAARAAGLTHTEATATIKSGVMSGTRAPLRG